MNFKTTRNALEGHVAAVWTGTAISRVAMDNNPFTKPEHAPWCRLSIIFGASLPVSIGGPTRRFRRPGILVFDIFTPQDEGAAVGTTLLDEAVLMFEGVTSLAGIRFDSIRPTQTPDSANPSWWHSQATVQFRFDDIH